MKKTFNLLIVYLVLFLKRYGLRGFFAIILSILVAPSFGLNPKTKARPIDLKTTILIAQRNDSRLRKLKFDSKAFQAEYDQSTKSFYPKITSELTKSNNANILTNPRGTTIFSFANSLTLPIYDRSLVYSRRKAKSQVLANRLNIVKRLNDLSKEMITLYYSVINLKAVAQIRKAEYRKTKKSFKLTREKLKYDQVIPLDLLQIKGLLVKNKNTWIDAYNDYLREAFKLSNKLNTNKTITLLRPTRSFLYRLTLKEALVIGLRERVDIKAKAFENKMKKELYEIERSVFYPKVELFSDIRYSSRAGSRNQTDWSMFVLVSMALLDDVNASTKAGFRKPSHLTDPVDEESIKISIFDGTSNQGRRASTKSEYLSSQDEMGDLKVQIKEEIMEAFHEYIKSKNNIKLARLNLKIGKRLLKKVRAEYGLGQKAIEDLIEARRNKVQFEIEYRQAQFNFHLSVFNLKWSIGILWRDFLET